MGRQLFVHLVLTGLLLAVLAGCGGDSPLPPPDNPPQNPPAEPVNPTPPTTPPIVPPTTPPGDTSIGGTVTAPAGGDVSGTAVFACPNGDCQSTQPQTTTVDASGTYTLASLPAGQYGVLAVKDVDGSNTLSNGDYVGAYSEDGQTLTLVTPPASGINITLVVYSDGSAPTEPVDPAPVEGGSISGTAFAPVGATIAGTTGVLACYPTGDQANPCDQNLSGTAQIQQPGSSVPYTVSGLQAGQYLMIAFADADGNGSFEDPTDFIGVYPSLQAPQPVSPPATGIDIQMGLVSELEAGSLKQATTQPLREQLSEEELAQLLTAALEGAR